MDLRTLAATVIGSDHTDTATNGQDAVSVKRWGASLVMAVADGCGSKSRSEVGANIGVHLCTTYFAQAIRRGQDITDARVRRHIRDRLAADLMDIGNKMAGDDPVAEYIRDHFLFTLLVAIVANGKLYIMRFGDGLYGVNDETVKLHPTAGNKPIYLAYAILGSSLTDNNPELLNFEIVAERDIEEVTTFWIGSDGLEEMVECLGEQVNGRPIEGPGDLLANDLYHDPDKPGRLAERLNQIVAAGFGSDDVTFAGAIVYHPQPEPSPDTSPEVTDQGKAPAGDEPDNSLADTAAESADPEADQEGRDS